MDRKKQKIEAARKRALREGEKAIFKAVHPGSDYDEHERDLVEAYPTEAERGVQSLTALTQKQWSPLVIRKVTRFGFPIYVALITDDNLNDLDQQIVHFVNGMIHLWKSNSLQEKRNLAGALTDHLVDHYTKTEGCAVIFYIDKTCISSLHGDFMNHMMCRYELYTLLHMSTGV